MTQPRVPVDLMDWLKKTYPIRGIRPDEDPIMAHRYAAQVELAQRLIRIGKGSSDEPDFEDSDKD